MGDKDNKIFLTIGAIGLFLVLLITTPGFKEVFGVAGNEGSFGMAVMLIIIVAILVYVAQGSKS